MIEMYLRLFYFFYFYYLFNYLFISIHFIFTDLFLLFYVYSVTIVCIFAPSLHPTPANPTSLPHLYPPPWFCPCVLYSPLVSVVVPPPSLLIVFIWVLSLFVLMCLLKGLSILFIFLKNQLLDSLILRIVLLVSMSFNSALIC